MTAPMTRASKPIPRSTPSSGCSNAPSCPIAPDMSPRMERCWIPYPSPERALMKTRKVCRRGVARGVANVLQERP